MEDGTKENAETDNYSKVSAGVEPVLLGSDAKYNDHEADQMVDNIIETAINLESGCVVQMGKFSSATNISPLNYLTCHWQFFHLEMIN